MDYFGSEIEGQGDHQPENWKNGRHEYWEKIKQRNAGELQAASSQQNIEDAISSAQWIERDVEDGDTLSAILKDEVGISGRMLLLALTHMSNQGMNIDDLNVGEKLQILKDNGVMWLQIEGRDDAIYVELFPDFTKEAPTPEDDLVDPEPYPELEVEYEIFCPPENAHNCPSDWEATVGETERKITYHVEIAPGLKLDGDTTSLKIKSLSDDDAHIEIKINDDESLNVTGSLVEKFKIEKTENTIKISELDTAPDDDSDTDGLLEEENPEEQSDEEEPNPEGDADPDDLFEDPEEVDPEADPEADPEGDADDLFEDPEELEDTIDYDAIREKYIIIETSDGLVLGANESGEPADIIDSNIVKLFMGGPALFAGGVDFYVDHKGNKLFNHISIHVAQLFKDGEARVMVTSDIGTWYKINTEGEFIGDAPADPAGPYPSDEEPEADEDAEEQEEAAPEEYEKTEYDFEDNTLTIKVAGENEPRIYTFTLLGSLEGDIEIRVKTVERDGNESPILQVRSKNRSNNVYAFLEMEDGELKIKNYSNQNYLQKNYGIQIYEDNSIQIWKKRKTTYEITSIDHLKVKIPTRNWLDTLRFFRTYELDIPEELEIEQGSVVWNDRNGMKYKSRNVIYVSKKGDDSTRGYFMITQEGEDKAEVTKDSYDANDIWDDYSIEIDHEENTIRITKDWSF